VYFPTDKRSVAPNKPITALSYGNIFITILFNFIITSVHLEESGPKERKFFQILGTRGNTPNPFSKLRNTKNISCPCVIFLNTIDQIGKEFISLNASEVTHLPREITSITNA